MYASGSAPGRNFCSIGLSSRQNSLFAVSAMAPPYLPLSVPLIFRSASPSRSPARHPRRTVPWREHNAPRPGMSPGTIAPLDPPTYLARAVRPQEARSVSGPVTARIHEVPVPEPDLTPETVIGRARALIPAVRDQQDEAERLGHHTAELDRQFAAAGFYRILQPRRFGGYEFGLPTFWQVMLAISAGDPGTGWGLTLGAHHALVVGSYFSEDGQRAIFGPSGDFRCPHRPPPMGTAEPAGKRAGEVGGGYMVSGIWDYCSGIAHATHFMGNAMVEGTTDRIAVVLPRDQVTVLDDWGDGAVLGMNSSGSNSVRVDAVFVPAHCTAPGDWTHLDVQAPGAALHGNPMYCGRIYAVYHAGLVIPVIGAARAALEEYEQIITTRLTYFPPEGPRNPHPNSRRTYAQALARTDAAEPT